MNGLKSSTLVSLLKQKAINELDNSSVDEGKRDKEDICNSQLEISRTFENKLGQD